MKPSFSLKWLFVGIAVVGAMLAWVRSCTPIFDMDYQETLQEFDLGRGRRLEVTRQPYNDISVPFNALFYDPSGIVFGTLLSASWDDSWRYEKGTLLRFQLARDEDLVGVVEASAPSTLLTIYDLGERVGWRSCDIHNRPGWGEKAAARLSRKSGKTLTLSPCGTDVLDRWKPSSP